MKRLCFVFLILFLLCSGLTACSPGHDGGRVVAFIRDGILWTSDPNGANMFAVVQQEDPVVGFSWSPNHQLLAFRTTNQMHWRESQEHSTYHLTGLVSDLPGSLHTIGVDGGTSIPLIFNNPDSRYSNLIWNSNGTRLIYRLSNLHPVDQSDQVLWSITQNDQPGGIAQKTLPPTYSIPSFSYQSEQYQFLGIGPQGPFTTTINGDQQRTITEALFGHPLPASLERILWQPGSHDQRFLYALPVTSEDFSDPSMYQLILGELNGKTETLTTCQCEQFAWSPDGAAILYQTPEKLSILTLQNHTTWDIPLSEKTVPYWSSDGTFLLLDNQSSLQLLIPAKQQLYTLLSKEQTEQEPPTTEQTLPEASTLLQPTSNSLWSPDNRHILFQTKGRLQWQEQTLQEGLYSVEINEEGKALQAPTQIATGNISQIGWTYQDANTAFLY